jgi:hypothetical protein
MEKISSEQIMEWEKDSIISELGYGLELNDYFLDRYCNQEFKDLMLKIPYQDRAYILSYADIKESWFNGSPTGNNDQHIWINIAEIEFQFEGDPSEVFEYPDDFTINGDLAYLYIGYGLSINFDLDELSEAIKDYKDES